MPERCLRNEKKTGMNRQLQTWIVLLGLAITSPLAAKDETVNFNRDIRPLLSDRCYKCHGPDEKQRQAGLRFDLQQGAMSETESGGIAIVPGKLSSSLIIQRITSDDPEERMPPVDSDKELSQDEIELITRWVKQGATWEGHWAYIAPQRPALPKQIRRWQTENSIDLFVQARLKANKLQPELRADKQTLIRRVTLDLTGQPPASTSPLKLWWRLEP